jgi:hypothetical protein
MNFPFLNWNSISVEFGRLFKSRRKMTGGSDRRDENYDQRSLAELGEEFAQKRKSTDDPSLTPLQRRMLSGGP